MDSFCTQESPQKAISVFSAIFEPPKKVNKTFYVCDRRFHLDEISEMFKDEIEYASVFISGNGFQIWKLTKSGEHFDSRLVYKKDMSLPNQHKTGGQSAVRFERLRDEALKLYTVNIVEKTISFFVTDGLPNIKGLIVCGPNLQKKAYLDSKEVKKYFSDIIEKIDTPEIIGSVISETLKKCKSIITMKESGIFTERVREIKDFLLFDEDKLLFGKEISEAISECSVSTIYISDALKDKINEFNEKKTYDINIIIIPGYLMKELGIEMMGVKFY